MASFHRSARRAWAWPLLAAAAPALAGQAPAELDAVVVTATRSDRDPMTVPAAVDSIDARRIHRAQPGINLSEALRQVPGVVARDRQNFAQDQQISIRGFGARATFGVRGIRLYTDGIPATMPDGQGQVSHFALASADRIEVLRGPFSALYGNASGGVIALFSAPPPPRPQAQGGYVAGQYGLSRGWTWLRGPWRSAPGGYSLELDRVDSEGYRRHGGARRDSGQALLRGRFGAGGEVTLVANALDLAADDPQGLDAAELAADRRAASPGALSFDTRKTVRQRQAGMRVGRDLGGGRLTVTGYAGNRRVAQMLSVPVFAQLDPLSGGGAIALDRDYGGIDARWHHAGSWSGRPLEVTVGVQREVSAERRRGYENFVGATLGVRGRLRRDEDDEVAGFDQYLQLGWQPGERWRVDLGVRHATVRFRSRDHYVTASNPDDSGRLGYSRTTPVAGVLYRASPHLSVYANAGSGFETPTFNELSYRGDGASGLNTGLRAARSANYEAGIRGRHDALAWSLAAFAIDTRDELVVASNDGGRSVYANAASSRRGGLELALSGAWNDRWHYALGYTRLDARLRGDATGARTRRIPGVSRDAAWGELRWQPAQGFDLALEGRYVGRVFADDANTAAAPAYASLDLDAERRWRSGRVAWTAFARVDNVFDRAIVGSVIVNERNGRYFEPAPGRNWVVGLSARIGGD